MTDQLLKELDGVSKSLKSSESKLSNSNFIDRAPKDVVDSEKEKVESLKLKKKQLEDELNSLK